LPRKPGSHFRQGRAITGGGCSLRHAGCLADLLKCQAGESFQLHDFPQVGLQSFHRGRHGFGVLSGVGVTGVVPEELFGGQRQRLLFPLASCFAGSQPGGFVTGDRDHISFQVIDLGEFFPHPGEANERFLQGIFGIFWDNPRVYNPASYMVCAPLVIAWGWVTLRARPSARRTWLALAAIAALTMLPVYHRQMDTKLLLITVPACAMLWAEGGRIGRLALALTTAGFVLTGDIPWAIFFGFISKLHLPATVLTGQILTAVQVFPAPLILLVMGIFYLRMYVRRTSPDNGRRSNQSEGLIGAA